MIEIKDKVFKLDTDKTSYIFRITEFYKSEFKRTELCALAVIIGYDHLAVKLERGRNLRRL